MPGMKGFDLLKNVRDRYPSTKRILITTYNVDYLELALKYDIGSIFVKTTPFNFEELSSIPTKLLYNHIFGINHYQIRKSKDPDRDAKVIADFIGETSEFAGWS